MIRATVVISAAFIFFLTLSSCSKDEPAREDPVKQAVSEPSPPSSGASAESAGAVIFMQSCSSCHGEGGKGDICPDLTDDEWKYGNSDRQLFRSISRGRPGGMPSWGNSLSEEQIDQLITYIRSIHED